MKKEIENNTKKLDKNDSSSNHQYNELIEKIDFKIDNDFLDFIKEYNGANGYLSNEFYILFWCIEDLLALNPYYEGVKECENLFFFGSNGSNLGYAFDKKNGNIVSIDFLEITQQQPEIIAESFQLFCAQQ